MMPPHSPLSSVAAGILLVTLVAMPPGAPSLTPLTEIKPTGVELAAFARTLTGALARLGLEVG